VTHGDCHDSEPLLAAVAPQCARPDQLRAIESHAAHCSTCSEELNETATVAYNPSATRPAAMTATAGTVDDYKAMAVQ